MINSKKSIKKLKRRYDRRIKQLQRKIDNNESILICENCNGYGRGTRHSVLMKDNPLRVAEICPKCGGEGIVDWIDLILNKNHIVPILDPDIYWKLRIKRKLNYWDELTIDSTIRNQTWFIRKKDE